MVAIEVIGLDELTQIEYVERVLKKKKDKTLGNIKDRILRNKRDWERAAWRKENQKNFMEQGKKVLRQQFLIGLNVTKNKEDEQWNGAVGFGN